ncbi:MAG TPA: hypothetical protein VMK13_03185 [Streptosporangiaceae bacterium]|nr:hypothetical protein [Streptosporangiaceae bacterium]
MSLYALVSPGGAPGVTTSAVALALGWPSQVIIAECDPSGGDILAGLFAGHLPASSGLLPLAVEAGSSADAAALALWHQLIDLDDERSRLLLAGITDPRQAAALVPSWPALAAAIAAAPADVVADCGRLDGAPAVEPVLTAASLAVLVLRPSLRQVSKARQRVEILTEILGGRDRLVLLLVGKGPHPAREIGRTLGVAVAATLPQDGKTACLLSDGAGTRRGLATRPLVRAAAAAGRALRGAVPGSGREAAGDAAPRSWAGPAGVPAASAGLYQGEPVALAAAPIWEQGAAGPPHAAPATQPGTEPPAEAPGGWRSADGDPAPPGGRAPGHGTSA